MRAQLLKVVAGNGRRGACPDPVDDVPSAPKGHYCPRTVSTAVRRVGLAARLNVDVSVGPLGHTFSQFPQSCVSNPTSVDLISTMALPLPGRSLAPPGSAEVLAAWQFVPDASSSGTGAPRSESIPPEALDRRVDRNPWLTDGDAIPDDDDEPHHLPATGSSALKRPAAHRRSSASAVRAVERPRPRCQRSLGKEGSSPT